MPSIIVVGVPVTPSGDGIGTGFLLNRRTLATAAHVVDGAQAVAVDSAEGTYPARVTGIDPANDLAVLRLSAPLSGHTFDFAGSDPQPGTTVAAIGFPLNEPKTLTVGTVSGLDRTIAVDGATRSGLLQTDTAINPGNSGGPLITSQGDIVGVVDALRNESQGIGYAVQSSVAAPIFRQQMGMEAPTSPDCGTAEGPEQLVVEPRLLAPVSPVTMQIQDRLATYYNAINGGDYEQVLQQFSPSYRVKFDADDLSRNLATSFDSSVVVREVTEQAGRAEAWVTFISIQAPKYGPDGQQCTQWSLQYTFARVGGDLLIDDVETRGGAGYEAC